MSVFNFLYFLNFTELNTKAQQILTVSTKLRKTKPNTYLHLLHTNEKELRERKLYFKNSNKYPIWIKAYDKQLDCHAKLVQFAR